MPSVHVTIDLYSGRPNPEWDVSPAEAEEFLARLKTLPPLARENAFQPDGLGYRGIEAILNASGAQYHYRIAGARFVRNDGAVFADAHRGTEHWLLRTGRGVLSEELLAHLLGADS